MSSEVIEIPAPKIKEWSKEAQRFEALRMAAIINASIAAGYEIPASLLSLVNYLVSKGMGEQAR
tara:strand:- start:246 stop:437 length:192 start_codon:yes stop_codon:yes gene_type:complete